MWDAKTNFWYLGLTTAGTICVASYFNYKINQWTNKRITEIKKDNKIDILRKNHLLAFGLSRQQCDRHMNREFDCGNLDCNYGRLRSPDYVGLNLLPKYISGSDTEQLYESRRFGRPILLMVRQLLMRKYFVSKLESITQPRKLAVDVRAGHKSLIRGTNYILGYINNCKKSLDVCIYIITAKLFGDCIINAQQRGVTVRVIADSDMSFSAQSLINTFRLADIPTRQRMSPFIMHHKFVIVDSEVLINGSMNFTMTGAFCNWENVMITTQPKLVDAFQKTFDSLWEDFDPANYSNNDEHITA